MQSSPKQAGERETSRLGPHLPRDLQTSRPFHSSDGGSVSTPSTTHKGHWRGGVGFLMTAASWVGKTPSGKTQCCL